MCIFGLLKIMLRVRWVGLLLACWVTNTLQQAVALDEGRKNEALNNIDLLKYIQERLKTSNASEYVNRLRSKSDLQPKAPKKVKITFRRRYRVRKEEKEIDETTPTTKTYESFTSKDKKILPVLLDYLKNHTGEEIRTGDEQTGDKNSTDVDNAGLEIQLIEIRQPVDKGANDIENNTQSENDSFESKSNRRVWNKNAGIPDVNQAHGKDVISTTKIDNPENGNQLTANTSLKADYKGKENAYNAILNQINSSQTDLLITKMCESSKSNVLEFWKLVAKYYGLDNENLSDKQKYDLFTIILKKANLKRKQEDLDILKPETESEKIIVNEVEPSQYSSEVNLFERSELEKQKDQKPNFNADLLFLSSNKTVIKQVNKSKHVKSKPEKNIFLNLSEYTSGEESEQHVVTNTKYGSSNFEYVTSKPDYIAVPVELSQDVISEFENKKGTKNTIVSEKTTTKPNLVVGNNHDDNKSYDDGVLFQITKSSKENTEQNQKTTYVTPESYDLPELFLSDTEKRHNFSNSSDSNEVDLYADTFEGTFNPDNELFIVSEAKRRSYERTEKTPLNSDTKQILQEINEVYDKYEMKPDKYREIINDFRETNRSEKFEMDNNRLKSLLQRLDSLPKDEVDEVVRYLKGKSKESHPKVSLDIDITNRSQNLKSSESDSTIRQAKINSKSNNNMKPIRDVDKMLLQIISRFREHGISDDALREIIIDLEQTLAEGNDECQSVKINQIKKAFEKLLDLHKKADTKKKY